MDRPNNILFITADQWRGECLSWLGHPCLKTPNLDALSRVSLVFPNTYAPSNHSNYAQTSFHGSQYARRGLARFRVNAAGHFKVSSLRRRLTGQLHGYTRHARWQTCIQAAPIVRESYVQLITETEIAAGSNVIEGSRFSEIENRRHVVHVR